MDILKQLNDIALQKSKNMIEDNFLIRGIWNIDLLFKPNIYERTFSYDLLIVQTLNQGACYCCGGRPLIDHGIIGKDARYASVNNRNIKIALLDSIYSLFASNPVKEFVLDGFSKEKSDQRAEIVVSEVLYQLKKVRKNKPSVVNIGVVGNLLKKLKEANIEVYATDLDDSIIEKDINGVVIKNGLENNMELLKKCDLAIVTGMTLASGTLGDIIKVARESNTKIVMFAETGAWFAQEYCNSFGIDAVISEPFPFYIFGGRSNIRVFRPTNN